MPPRQEIKMTMIRCRLARNISDSEFCHRVHARFLANMQLGQVLSHVDPVPAVSDSLLFSLEREALAASAQSEMVYFRERAQSSRDG